MALEQQPYNLFAQQKMAGYPSATNPDTSARVAGQATVTPTQPIAQEPPVTNTTAQTQKVTPVQPQITSMDDLVNAMYTSPQEEERMRRASVANQRILAVGDALRHIGNIANTINYAPAQQLNSPVLEEEARYKQGKALRDKANLTYLNYQQAKAAQDAKARQWAADQERRANQFNATLNYNAMRDAARLKDAQNKWQATLSYRAENDKANRDLRGKHYNEMEKQGRQRIGIASQNAKSMQEYRKFKMNGGGGGGKAPYMLAAPNGGTLSLPRSLNSVQIDQVISNPEFKKYRNRNQLQEAMLRAGIQTNDPAQVRRYEAAMMIAQHPEVAQWAAAKFGGRIDGMQMMPQAPQQSGMNGFIAPGNTWSQPGTNFDWSQYLAGIASQEDANNDDDEVDNWDDFLVE